MTKSELIESVANKLKLPKGKAELIVNCVFDSMEAALKNGERIEIRGFGSFEIRHYKAYEGRNPRTGTRVEVKPKRLPFFKVGKELKERVNNGRLADHAPLAEPADQAAADVAPAAAPVPTPTPTPTPEPVAPPPPAVASPFAAPPSEPAAEIGGSSSDDTPNTPKPPDDRGW